MTSFPIPDAALEHHVAILGKTGSGKTVAAKGMVELVLDTGGRCCAIDPTGVWHGLRSNASGKGPGYPVVIFGGPHGDVPLPAHQGEAIAEIIGTSSTSAVIDTSGMKVSERTRFFADFADALVRKNKGPLHLVIDECHVFMPQGRVADPMSGQMLHAANNLVSLGRSRGLRITLISQRPAKVHKDSLTQVETLVAMRLIAPQDRNAVEAWIEDNADDEKGDEIIGSLATLKTGEAWLWAPEIGVLERVKFPKNRTFDSSRAPDLATGTGPVLAPINLAAVHERLATIEAETKANDPKALKAEIARLKSEMQKLSVAKSDSNRHSDADIEAANRSGYQSGYADGWTSAKVAAEKAAIAATNSIRRAVDDSASDIKAAISSIAPPQELSRYVTRSAAPQPKTQSTGFPKPAPQVNRITAQPVRANGHDELSAPQRRILSSVAFWKSIGHDAPTREQVAAVAGYKPSSGGFNNLIGSLKTAGYLDIPMPGRVSLTDAAPYDGLSPEEARDKMLAVLSAPQRKIVDAALGYESATRAEIARDTEYSEGSGGFNNLIGSLCTLGILEKPAPGAVAVSAWAREVLA